MASTVDFYFMLIFNLYVIVISINYLSFFILSIVKSLITSVITVVAPIICFLSLIFSLFDVNNLFIHGQF